MMVKQLPLPDGRYALVDEHTYALAINYRWFFIGRSARGFYIGRHRRTGPAGRRYQTTLYLHRLVMGEPPHPGLEVDHRNGDPLDCRRANLRWATPSQNQQNRRVVQAASGHRNVYHHHAHWRVRMVVAGRHRSFGSFKTVEEAAHAAAAARRQHFGEFAPEGTPR